MNRGLITITAAAGALGLALGGCGGGTRTVSVSSQTPGSAGSSGASAPSASTPTGTAGGATAPAGASAGQNGGVAAPGGSRTGSGPAFVGSGGAARGLSGALAVLHARGFAALDTGQYRRDQTLRVLVGARQGSADAHVQQAFFFVDGRYLGTDTKLPSAQIHVLGQNDTQVTLAYSLYRPRDALCCPSGGQAQVRYQLDNGRLAPLDPIPSADASAASSRQ